MIVDVVLLNVAGLVIGAGSVFVARRSTRSHEQSLRRQRIVQGCFLVAVLGLLLFDAVDSPQHRSINLVIVAVGAVGFDWLRSRRCRIR